MIIYTEFGRKHIANQQGFCNTSFGTFHSKTLGIFSFREPDVVNFIATVFTEVQMNVGALSLILDFSDHEQVKLAGTVFNLDVPATIFDLNGLRQRQEALSDSCPFFIPWTNLSREERSSSFLVPEDSIYIREQLIPAGKQRNNIFVWAKQANLQKVLSIFESTVMDCKQKWNLGVFNKDTKFLFLTENENETETVFSLDSVTKHPSVAAMQRSGDATVQFWSYNFYHETNGKPRLLLNELWRQGAPPPPDGAIFTPQETFGGREFRAVAIPYAHMVQATYLGDGRGGRPGRRFERHWGVSLEIVAAMQERLDFTIAVYNPTPVYAYGSTDPDGRWNGAAGMVKRAECEMMVEYVGNYEAAQITEMTFINIQGSLPIEPPSPLPLSYIVMMSINIIKLG